MLTRAIKEFRPLLMPGGLVVAGALAVASLGAAGRPLESLTTALWPVTFVVGIALAAALPFGSEFQQRTMVLLISQPISRGRIWFEKWVILAVAIGIIGAISVLLTPDAVARQEGVRYFAALYVAAVVCSASYWTLVARSTVGGAVFSMSVPFMLVLGITFVVDATLAPTAAADGQGRRLTFGWVAVLYSLTMLWLGWRRFANLQVTHASGESAGPGGGLGASRTLAWLRADPARSLRNLLVNEVHLHRPTFLVAAVLSGAWLAVLGTSAMQPARGQFFEVALNVVAMCHVVLVFLMAGCVSGGEEASLGVRTWQLTLPVSARRLWLVKLGAAALVAGVLGYALPRILGTLASVDFNQTVVALLARPAGLGAVVCVLVMGFWAAAMFGHTIRATVGAVTMLSALALCAIAAMGAGAYLTFLTRLGMGLLTPAMVRFQLTPHDLFSRSTLTIGTWAIAALLVGIALRQSFMAFKRVETGGRQMATSAGVLLAVAFGSMLLVVVATNAAASMHESEPVRQLQLALQNVSDPAQAAYPAPARRIVEQELLDKGTLSASTRAWIAGSEITVDRIAARTLRPSPQDARAWFRATVTFPNGRVYKFLYRR